MSSKTERPSREKTAAKAEKEKANWQARAEEILQLPANRIWYATTGAATLAALGLLLPWMWIDDHATPHTMADLITFYAGHDDKWYLARTTPLGTLAMLAAPMLTTIFVISNAIKAVINEPSTSVAIAAVITTLTLMLLTGEITDPDRARMGSVAIPLAGMSLTMLGNLACIGLNTWEWTKQRRDQEGTPDGRRGFEW